MKIPVEVEVPDGAMLTDWCAAYEYMTPEGELLVGCDYSDAMTGSKQIGLLLGVADAVRYDQVSKWHPREEG